jgi:D-alanine-D-alanine ligase
MKKKIALITGGYSGEAVISYKSANNIEKHLDTDKWETYKIDINPSGWNYLAPGGLTIPVDKNDFSITVGGNKIHFDAVLVGLHGTPGEDGKLQGYFDTLNIPYTAFAGIHVAKSVHLFKHIPVSTGSILASLQLPVFVKPNNGGSSIGMSKVKDAGDLQAALDKAFAEDDQVLVEEFIKGRELTIGVFKSKGEVIALPITEIIAKNEFFDYQAKYEGASEEITPAVCDETIAEKVRAEAKKAYAVFNCNGLVRIDFIYDEASGNPYMLEINTVPGQSEASIVPQQVVAMGWTLQQFYTALLDECFYK